MFKRLLFGIVSLFVLTVQLLGCQSSQGGINESRLKIVTTLFPQYDFARQVAGDRADVTLLIPPGVESHAYEPTPADMRSINTSNLFIYTGENMEAWAQKLLSGIDNSKVKILDVSAGVELTEGHDDGDYLDPHIWTDPNNAMVMVTNIKDTLCQMDAKNAQFYTDNAQKYMAELEKLDTAFQSAVESGTRREVVFGGRNAFRYFLSRYGLKDISAYSTCAAEGEPSVKAITLLTDEIKLKQIPVIYYEELSEPTIAKSISSETGAKMLLLHSCHNLTKEEFDGGQTYISLMNQNLKNLMEALG